MDVEEEYRVKVKIWVDESQKWSRICRSETWFRESDNVNTRTAGLPCFAVFDHETEYRLYAEFRDSRGELHSFERVEDILEPGRIISGEVTIFEYYNHGKLTAIQRSSKSEYDEFFDRWNVLEWGPIEEPGASYSPPEFSPM
tara:strand:+ start:4458 stop:4883 length:426 start_codon:yes stop_codon:yes gene_type:complete